jgi:hypothetical protein
VQNIQLLKLKFNMVPHLLMEVLTIHVPRPVAKTVYKFDYISQWSASLHDSWETCPCWDTQKLRYIHLFTVLTDLWCNAMPGNIVVHLILWRWHDIYMWGWCRWDHFLTCIGDTGWWMTAVSICSFPGRLLISLLVSVWNRKLSGRLHFYIH